MKISYEWLQTFFEKPLPDVEAVGEALTFHAFEIDGIENGILDVKVTPNRGHDCLCHRGIAKEVAAILDLPMQNDSLRQKAELGPKTDTLSVTIQDALLCPRYIAGYMRRVKVGPSPDWLRKSLESIGQRSINNVVDATNFVMFNLGQPLHAFDAGKLQQKDTTYAIGVRLAKDGEKIIALDEKEYALSSNMLVITDAHSDTPIGIAGVKGGMPASITTDTHDIIIESANFNGPSVRKTAAGLKLRTDASTRFEQEISPWLCVYGMKAVVELIQKIAGGEIVGFSSDYSIEPEKHSVAARLEKINGILGSHMTSEEAGDTLRRLDLSHTQENGSIDVHVPFERLDLNIEEDVVEEVGRIHGYDKVQPQELPMLPKKPEINDDFFASEHVREDLIAKGYSEVYTSVFAEKGERVVANKVDGVKPYLRTSLIAGLTDALERNRRIKDVLALKDVKLFEIGSVWHQGHETVMIGTADEKGVREEELVAASTGDSYESLPLSSAERYQPFSKYPFISRDVAMWTPAGTKEDDVLALIRSHAGELLVKSYCFDRFEKGDQTSLAFRLIFQSFDKTLTDFDANERMESISSALQGAGFTIR